MTDTDSHVFICCERGDLAGWMEASWLADQDLDIWCEDGVNPGNPEWDDCAEAILSASHCVFLVTEAFVRAKGAVNKLRFALSGHAPCIALLLEPVSPEPDVAALVQKCHRLDKRQLPASSYVAHLGDLLGAELTAPPDAAFGGTSERAESYVVGEWRVFPQLLRIVAGNESKTLDRKIFDVLELLIQRAPEVVTIDEFLAEVWAGTLVEDNSLHRAISKLRKAFRDDPREPRYIETIPRSGYRLLADVARSDSPAADVASAVSRAQSAVQIRPLRASGQVATELADFLAHDLQQRLHDGQQREGAWQVRALPDAAYREEESAAGRHRPELVVTGAVFVLGEGLRVHLELIDHGSGLVRWAATESHGLPRTLADADNLSAHWADALTGALREHLA